MRWIKISFFLAFIGMVLSEQDMEAAVVEAWVQRHAHPATNVTNGTWEARSVAIDHEANILLTGKCVDAGNANMCTIKYQGSNGRMLWFRHYNAPSNQHDFARQVAVDNAGNAIVTGSSSGQYYTTKYATADGAVLWERVGPPGAPEALAVDATGDVLIAGPTTDPGGWSDYYTARYSGLNGSLLWERRYNGPAMRDDIATAIAVDAHGNAIVTGTSQNVAPNFDGDFYTIKYAADDGAVLWSQRHGSSPALSESAAAVGIDRNGDVIVTGQSGTNGYTAKYDAATGQLLWERYQDGPVTLRSIAVGSSGNVIVAGFFGPQAKRDYFAASYAGLDGAMVWERRYNGPANGNDEAQAVAVDENGDVIVMGTSRGTEGSDDFYTAKYAASNGALLWEQRYNGPTNANDHVATTRCLAVGRNGVVAVSGTSDGLPGTAFSGDTATVVYWQTLPAARLEVTTTEVRLRASGIPGRSYEVQRAAAVDGPWEPLASGITPADGVIAHVETAMPTTEKFYRVKTW
jgi:hypothetical protein